MELILQLSGYNPMDAPMLLRYLHPFKNNKPPALRRWIEASKILVLEKGQRYERFSYSDRR
jgi:hypothetical protein